MIRRPSRGPQGRAADLESDPLGREDQGRQAQHYDHAEYPGFELFQCHVLAPTSCFFAILLTRGGSFVFYSGDGAEGAAEGLDPDGRFCGSMAL